MVVRSGIGVVLFVVVVGCTARVPGARLHGRQELVLLHTADTHSMLFPYRLLVGSADARRGLGRAGEWRDAGGFARLATALRAERARAGRALHLDAGDVFQGSLAFERFEGEPELRAFDAMGVDAQALGNHELDRGGVLVAGRYQRSAAFPLLAVNYAADGAGPLSEVVKPYVVLETAGLRVGVIGVGNTGSVALLHERPGELSILARAASEAVQGALDVLRPNVDLCVVVTHLGLDADHELVRGTSGIDVVLGGHQHLTLDEPEWENDCAGGRIRDAWGGERACASRRVPIVHSGAYTKTFGRVTLSLDDEPARLAAAYDPLDGFEVTSLELALVPVSDNVPDDPAVAEVLAPYREELTANGAETALAYAPRPVERYGATGGDSPLGNVAAGVLRRTADADVAVLGASSLRRDLPPGVVDLERLVEALPFEDPLVRVVLDGAALARAFEHAALSASRRDCRTQVHVSGALVRFRCPCDEESDGGSGCARVFATETDVPCVTDTDCAPFDGACDAYGDLTGFCYAPLDARAPYVVATTAYLAAGGSGLFDAIPEFARPSVSERLSDALADELRGGDRCAPSLCDGADAVCRTLPCLSAAEGARRDGRIRFEAP